MRKEIRTICYDQQLKIEAYKFEGIAQPFPNHFHDYYVIGFVEEGSRILSCCNKKYTIKKGSILIFNPGDNHSCHQINSKTFNYSGFNIEKQIMLDIVEEITGKRELPYFAENVIYDNDLKDCLQQLHKLIMNEFKEFSKEEYLYMMMTILLQKYMPDCDKNIPECRAEIKIACDYMQLHFHERMSLKQICDVTLLSKSTLIRAFTMSKGVTPYQYLESLRMNEAKKLLEEDISLSQIALQTGFSDQSHFTKFFSQYIGLTPGVYRSIFQEYEKRDDENE